MQKNLILDAHKNDNKKSRLNQERKIISFSKYKDLKSRGFSSKKAAQISNIARSTAIHLEKTEVNVFGKKTDNFLSSFNGKKFIDEILITALFTFCIDGNSGINKFCDFLRETKLSNYVASSYGYWQEKMQDLEKLIIDFGEDQNKKLGQAMLPKEVTIKMDETFFTFPCLVSSEAESNFIFLEKFTADRKAETWSIELKAELLNYNIKVIQVVSDQGSAIKSVTEHELQAQHSPDLFHIEQDLSKKVIGPLSRKTEQAQKALIKSSNFGVDSKEYKDLYSRYMTLCLQKEYLGINLKDFSKNYHPIDLNTGEFLNIENIMLKLHKNVAAVMKLSDELLLDEKVLSSIKKVENVLGETEKMFNFYRNKIDSDIARLGLVENSHLIEKIISSKYLDKLIDGNNKLDKEKLSNLKSKIESEIFEITEGKISNSLLNIGDKLASLFQRSSSSIEGRNGILSQKYHTSKGLSNHKLQVQKTLHNYHSKRVDGSTAAERFFNVKHESLLSNIKKKAGSISMSLRKKTA